jgi:Fe-S cluster biogenesis protein NfuA
MPTSSPVEDAVFELNNLVAKDGGSLTLLSHSPASGSAQFQYVMAEGEDCDSCAITPEIMQAFLEESLRVRGAAINDITLLSPSAGEGVSGE